MDAMSFVEGDPIILLQIWMKFHLMCERDLSRVVQQSLELLRGEVRNANVSGLSGAQKPSHGFPCIQEIDLVAMLLG